MVEWEYRKIDLNGHRPRGDEIDLLDEAGAEGWELVGVTHNSIAFLKRPIPRDTALASAEANGARVSEAERRVPMDAKYRDPVTNETWSGRGRMAGWLKRKQQAGENIERYLVRGARSRQLA